MISGLTLGALLSERARHFNRKVCITFEKRKISYSELDNRVDLCAGGLHALGLNVQDRVAVLMTNCPEYIISYFAILRAGGITVPVNTLLTAGEISYILNDSGCRMLIYDESFSSHVEKIVDDVPALTACRFHDIPRTCDEQPTVSEDDVAVFLYTSGTTGFPKGAMLTHRNLISNADAIMQVVHLSHKDRILLFLPLFHSFSFTVCVLLPIYAGARTVLLPSVKPFSKVIRSIFRDRITFFVAVPTVYNILSRKKMPFFMKHMLRLLISIKACISGAASLPESTIKRFEERFSLPLVEGYGLTEASPVVAVNPIMGVRKATSVGPPLPGVEVCVAGEDGRTMPPEGVGELFVRGPNVMKGYFNKVEETDAVLKDGWLHTGDMAKIDKDGYIYIVDRKKDMVIVDGMNIYPKEVEDIVMKHGGVEECAMVGIPDGRGSEVTVLFVKGHENTRIGEEEIRSHLKERVARFKVPRRIIFVNDFPRTSTGKVKKTELRTWKL